MKRLLLVLVLVCFCVQAKAQVSGNSGAIMEVSAYLSSIRSNTSMARTSGSGIDHLENLLNEVQPAVYLSSGQVKTFGDQPTALYTDVSSLADANSLVSSKESIEMVTIRMERSADLRTIDLSLLSSFPNLKYVYLLSTIETTANTLVSLVQNTDSRFVVFYKISKGA
ncbi:hypothetical protein KIH23_04625 [Flavobacterium sp. CYK-55]|uniref:hypothetical protein n=1 Tax=Flavobacterium sp. CYK-55 TaxID=2835529 RepID=UPI001BD17CD2|nr:hypothetical protein [Flavobacterium sp. CYK-55]MBS7786572.1 hypothetical protein [Flavobacterium sp. CYK-55]